MLRKESQQYQLSMVQQETWIPYMVKQLNVPLFLPQVPEVSTGEIHGAVHSGPALQVGSSAEIQGKPFPTILPINSLFS